MIFSIIIVIAIALIAYFHYAQGFFSATVSAIIAIIAAVLSVSYSETLVNTLFKGKMPDSAEAAMLCLLFAAIYLVLRIIFDKAVPGNLRFPAIADAIGGGLMGVVAGIFATGVFALAAQTMGFGPAIGGYSVFPMHGADRNVIIVADRRQVDAVVTNEVDADKLDPAQQKSLVVPVDTILLSLVQHLSDNGSLAGDRTLDSVHPNWPLELFGQRLGVQVGSKRTALNFPPTFDWIKVAGVYAVASLPSQDGELAAVRGKWTIPPVQRPAAGQSLLVVRVTVDHNAGDDADSLFRFSTGAVRLLANKKDYYPLGTVYNGSTLLMQKPDDPLFLDVASDGEIDFAFMVDSSDLFGDSARSAMPKITDGTFIEVKRYGRVDLSGSTVKTALPAPAAAEPIRRTGLAEQDKLGVATTGAPAAVASASPVQSQALMPAAAPTPPAAENSPALVGSSARMSNELPHTIGVNTTDVNGQNIAVAGGTVSLADSRMSVVKIDPSADLAKLATGDNQLTELHVPAGQKMVQITTGPTPPSDWFDNAAKFSLTDTAGKQYPCNGVYAVVSNGAVQGFFVRYAATGMIPSPTAPSGKAAAATYLFLVPTGTALTSVSGAGAPVTLSLTAQ